MEINSVTIQMIQKIEKIKVTLTQNRSKRIKTTITKKTKMVQRIVMLVVNNFRKKKRTLVRVLQAKKIRLNQTLTTTQNYQRERHQPNPQ